MPLTIWSIEGIDIMTRIEAVHDEEEELKTEDRGLGWWMLLPVMAVGLLVYQIADASMESVFDEDE